VTRAVTLNAHAITQTQMAAVTTQPPISSRFPILSFKFFVVPTEITVVIGLEMYLVKSRLFRSFVFHGWRLLYLLKCLSL